MYVQIQGPKIHLEDNNGQPAVGYEIHVRLAGTTTPADSYYNRDLALIHKNTNPIILDARGECDIFTGVALKLIFTIPGGDPSSPIWEEDYQGEQQNTSIITGAATPVTLNNNYVCDVVPPFTSSIPNNLTLVMTPDVDNLNTLTSMTFTGTGINDITFVGPYIGTTVGSIFLVEIESVYLQPPIAPVAALSAVAGSVTAGVHSVKVTFVTAEGETLPGNPSSNVTADGAHKIDTSVIPLGPTGTLSRKIYMNKAAGAIWYYVDEIADNVTTTYAIDVADAALTVVAPTTNTTGDSAGADTIKWRKDGGAWHTGISISGAYQNLIEGMTFKFAELSGHTLGDTWAETVMTPARLNFCGLGNDLINKISGGALVALGPADMKANIPATLVRAATSWILNNPSLPVLTALIPTRIRKELTSDYIATTLDQGTELSCIGTFTITLPACSTVANQFFYFNNVGYGIITIQVAGGLDKIVTPENPAGQTSIQLSVGGRTSVQLVTNGTNWHILTQTSVIVKPMSVYGGLTITNNAVTPATKIDVTADFVGVVDSINNYISINSLSKTINGAVNGINGLDAGALVNDTQYYIYVIAKPDGTAACLLSTSGTAPVMPAGYTFKKVVGWAAFDTGVFALFHQYGDKISYDELRLIVHMVPAAYSGNSIIKHLPTISTSADFHIHNDGSAAAVPLFYLAWTVAPLHEAKYGIDTVGATVDMSITNYPLNPAQPEFVAWKSTATCDLYISGFKIRI